MTNDVQIFAETITKKLFKPQPIHHFTTGAPFLVPSPDYDLKAGNFVSNFCIIRQKQIDEKILETIKDIARDSGCHDIYVLDETEIIKALEAYMQNKETCDEN